MCAVQSPLLTHVSADAAAVAPSLASAAHGRCLFSVNHPSVVLETVKKAEEDGDTSASLVLRAVESWGGRRKVRIHSHLLRPVRVTRVNLLEEPEAAHDDETLECKDGVIEVVFKPFQIVTLKLDLH
jgi:alpha-mannosidase